MSSLEERLNQELSAADEKAREAKTQKEAEEKKKQEHKARFVPIVTESVDDFPRLARKYGTATSGIEIYKRKFFGLGKKYRAWTQAWQMPAGIYLTPDGTFYRYDHYVSGLYGGRSGSIYEPCTREEAIGIICSSYSGLGLADLHDPDKAPQAIREYVQNAFVKCLRLRKTEDGSLYYG